MPERRLSGATLPKTANGEADKRALRARLDAEPGE